MTEQQQSLQSAYAPIVAAMREDDFGQPVDPGAWPAEMIAAHIILTNDLLADAARSVGSGEVGSFDSGPAHEGARLREVLVRTGALSELAQEVERSASDLQAAYAQLSDEQRQTPLRTRLFHDGAMVVDEQRPLGATIQSSAREHIEVRLTQLLDLRDD